jgi:acid phosphatase (class A)
MINYPFLFGVLRSRPKEIIDGMNPLCRHAYSVFIVFATTVLLTGCAGPEKRYGHERVTEVRPGVWQGYLPADALPDSLALLPPPPAADSTAFALDEEISRKSIALQGSPRWKLAAKDASLTFPRAAAAFSCALGAPITEEKTPRLYRLMRRTATDARFSTDAAKSHYRRIRPFVVNKEPTCTPEKEKYLMMNGSYPSGHTALGWAWALILSEIAPERADAILARGWAFGQSRVICNVHWQSDVMMGRLVGAAAVAGLHADPAFRAAIKAAKEELEVVRVKGLQPTRDCKAEAGASARYPPSAPWPANK